MCGIINELLNRVVIFQMLYYQNLIEMQDWCIMSAILIHIIFNFFLISAVGSGGGSSGSGPANVLVPGDVVEVVEGDLMNLQGKVQGVDGDTITIMPRHEDLKVDQHLFICLFIIVRDSWCKS